MAKDWRVAKSLEMLRAQANQVAPRRGKASDGTIGDAAHRATKSEHNPDKDGVVRALDLTHDPVGGLDCQKLFDSLLASRDPRIQYVIWDRKIFNREVQPWVVRPYSGDNPHTKHLHVSVDEDPKLYDDQGLWTVPGYVGTTPPVLPRTAPTKPEAPSPAPAPPVDEHERHDHLVEKKGFFASLLDLILSLFGKGK